MDQPQKQKTPPKCSFCGKSADQVAKMVAGPDAYICSACVALCSDIMGATDEAPGPDVVRAPPSEGPRRGQMAQRGAGAATASAPPRLVLASSSVARLRLLRDAGFDPAVVVSGVSEEFDGLTPTQAVVALAERKALTVAHRGEQGLVIGCDSMLEVDGEALGKPASGAEATQIWRRLSGREAALHTGHCLIDTARGHRVSRLATSVVHFGSPSEAELRAYTATKEPLTLAGAFSIDGLSGPFVEAINGSPSNVLGLSLPDFREMLAQVGVRITELWRSGLR